MKIPEPLFKFINRIVILLLRSPMHGFWSNSLVVIRFQGRKTGRQYETPVRYVQAGDQIQCFTSKSGNWWRNVAAADQVTLLLKGGEANYTPQVTVDDPEKIAAALRHCLSLFPQDAVYHDMTFESKGVLDEAVFDRELPNVVLVTFTKI